VKILIYEHLSAGGFREEGASLSVLSEGFGMLRTAAEDAKSAGHAVTAILDGKIARLSPSLEADRKITVHSLPEAEIALFKAVDDADATYIIAPETENKLEQLVRKVEKNRVLSLNSTSTAIAQAADKLSFQRHAAKLGLATPKTLTFTIRDSPDRVAGTVGEKIGFPAVLKPTESAGCEALGVINDKEQLEAAVAKLSSHTSSFFIVQQPIQGIAASVTIISNGTEARPITLNKQNIALKTPNEESNYNGGATPLDNKLKAAAFAATKQLVESIEGLHGYVGVDLVLTESKPVVIEVNPRLTTSYVGVRRIVKLNLMQATINAVARRELPEKQETTGYAHFEKVKTRNPTNAALKQTFNMAEIVSPPFPLTDSHFTWALVCTQGATPQQAKLKFNKAKRLLQTTLQEGGKRPR
jgi:predicted ATP-grasp superfamily ATP-dependent carboligase